jgi:hypothetical protein
MLSCCHFGRLSSGHLSAFRVGWVPRRKVVEKHSFRLGLLRGLNEGWSKSRAQRSLGQLALHAARGKRIEHTTGRRTGRKPGPHRRSPRAAYRNPRATRGRVRVRLRAGSCSSTRSLAGGGGQRPRQVPGAARAAARGGRSSRPGFVVGVVHHPRTTGTHAGVFGRESYGMQREKLCSFTILRGSNTRATGKEKAGEKRGGARDGRRTRNETVRRDGAGGRPRGGGVVFLSWC